MIGRAQQTTAIPETRQRIFRLLVLYRWLSLVPPLIYVLVLGATAVQSAQLLALLAAFVLNGLITLLPTQLNQRLRAWPWLLLFDLLLAAIFIALTGGWQSSFYLYALSPLMAAAFFFELRGAVVATTFFVPMYVAAVSLATFQSGDPIIWLTILRNVIGFYLISGTFGYAAVLMGRWREAGKQLSTTHQELADAHRDLEVLHSLTAALHDAADVEEVQEMVLRAVTTQLGCRKAVIGLVDPAESVLTGWLAYGPDGAVLGNRRQTHSARLPLDPESSLAATALAEGRICRVNDGPCAADSWLNAYLQMEGCLIVPLRWGLQPVGVLLVDLAAQESLSTRLRSLEAIAQQTAVAIGMMTTRQRRARESAVQEERARIAMDIHDSVSQSLFGIVFTLDGTLKLLPDQPEAAMPELQHALETAESVRQDIRRVIHDIWPEEITAQAFETDLHNYVANVLQAPSLLVDFDIRGDFSALSARARRSLYRISQESLTNVVNHAAASEARVCLDVGNGRAQLVVRDNGRGFEPQSAQARTQSPDHFGLLGMQERARSLGGTCDIFSQPEAGTSIVVDIPVHWPNGNHHV